ncbi:LPXTG cell wall anchor domain-containing protein [Facklamia languida]|uniref:LPXTG-domain-containing protein cell wall anchor domain n=1 Tax=Facklamia languida CCUG 37842 TaxID=883113 RepID=H3NK12_9LACT|nr:LPXTG cell wall anchor domain-containing protein [Facklamia languida]EHR36529.1 LPXTG-domain-containing protein cell wall anchor domain [Facklamia languida CCUG 37842]
MNSMLPQTGEAATWILVVVAVIALIGGISLLIRGKKNR